MNTEKIEDEKEETEEEKFSRLEYVAQMYFNEDISLDELDDEEREYVEDCIDMYGEAWSDALNPNM